MNINQQELPDKNNFYASFRNVNKSSIKEVLERSGWVSRKHSWTDYELRNEWSELVLEGDDNEPLLNGAVVYIPSNIQVLDKIFETLNGYFQYEFYDDFDNILLEKKKGS